MLLKVTQMKLRRNLFSLLLATMLFVYHGPLTAFAANEPMIVPSSLSLNVGDSLSLEHLPSGYQVESTNPQIVSVSQDNLIAKRAGTVKILFEVGQATRTCTVTVTRTNAKTGVYEYIYPDKSGAKDSIIVLSRNQGTITFILSHQEKDYKVVTKEITVGLNGNETATFLWQDDQGGQGLGRCVFTGKNATVTMISRFTSENDWQWWSQSCPMTLTQASMTTANS